MSTSLYHASTPGVVHHMKSMITILDLAARHAEEKKIDASVFLNARLAPDMLPFARQIQLASDGIKGFAARVTKTEIPSFADTESTFEELKERLTKTIAFIESIEEAKFDGADVNPITFTTGKRELSFPTGLAYLTRFALPNYYFHATTAYDILRHNGVPLGKLDYLGGR